MDKVILGNNTQAEITDGMKKTTTTRGYNLFFCHFLEDDDDDVVDYEVTK